MKTNRHSAILNIIENNSIETQEELCAKLNAEGYDVTQATVSRDIRALKLTKVTGNDGRAVYKTVPGNTDFSQKYLNILKNGFVSMDMAQNILVVKTVTGMAMAVATTIDAMAFNSVLGCIAGDDTIMIAVRTVDDCLDVMKKLRDIIDN